MTDDLAEAKPRKPRLGPARAAVEPKPWPPEWDDIPLHKFIDPSEWHTLSAAYWRKFKPRQPRKPDIRKLIADAEKFGKSVTGVTLPDGTVLHFGESSDPTKASGNELDEWMVKHAH